MCTYMCIGGLSQTYKIYVLTANHVFDYSTCTLYIITPLQLILLHSVSFLAEPTSINTTTNNTASIVIRKSFDIDRQTCFFCDLHFNLRVVSTLPLRRVSDMVPLKSGSLPPHACFFLEIALPTSPQKRHDLDFLRWASLYLPSTIQSTIIQ